MFDSFRRPVQDRRPVVPKTAASSRLSAPSVGLRLYLAISAVVHALAILLGSLAWPVPEKPRTQLEVYLKPLDLPAPPEPPVPVEPEPLPPPPPVKTVVAEPPKPALESTQGAPRPVPPKPEPAPETKPVAKPGLAPQQRKQLAEQVLAFYPDEYVQQRLEGDVVLRLFVDNTSGKVLAIRVETPSPLSLFNEAARQAALSSISALSPGMPGEVLLPVRFRLGN